MTVHAEHIEHTSSGRPQGVLQLLKAYFSTNRVGDLLVLEGRLAPQALAHALKVAKTHNRRIGQVLVDERLIRRHELYATLGKQWGLRMMAWSVAMFMSVGPMMPRQSRADERSSTYAITESLNMASAMRIAYNKPATVRTRQPLIYPALFGSSEQKSQDLSAFKKWTSMFDRYNAQRQTRTARAQLASFQQAFVNEHGDSLADTVRQVDQMINRVDYVDDRSNYGRSDYWATPAEFFKNGGDCEDYAIAKYMTLRTLGVSEARMRIAIVHDLVKNIPHAILIVYTDAGPMVLDNQSPITREASDLTARYKPIFSINEQAWWLHTNSPDVQVATAAR